MTGAATLAEAQLERAVAYYVATLAAQRRIFCVGNGGSAAQAIHTAAEYTVRLRADQSQQKAWPVMALGTDVASLTAAVNDFSAHAHFARLVEAWVERKDLLVCYSTSGRSLNILEAARVARHRGAFVVAWTTDQPCPLREAADATIGFPGDSAAIQEATLAGEHWVATQVLRQLERGSR